MTARLFKKTLKKLLAKALKQQTEIIKKARKEAREKYPELLDDGAFVGL